MTTDTKTALLDAAEHAARRRGFDGFSYADLAADVGIRKASIHHHYPTKAALSLAMMQRYAQDLANACAAIDTGQQTAGDRLAALITLYREALEDGHSLCLCVAFSTSRDSLPADVIKAMGQFRADRIDWLTQVFTLAATDNSILSVTDPLSEGAATLALLEGAQLAARVAEKTDLFDEAVHLLRSRLR